MSNNPRYYKSKCGEDEKDDAPCVDIKLAMADETQFALTPISPAGI